MIRMSTRPTWRSPVGLALVAGLLAVTLGPQPAPAQTGVGQPPAGPPRLFSPQVSGALQRAVETVTPAVVSVRVFETAPGRPEPWRPATPSLRSGSGFIVEPSGYIVTSNQVVGSASALEVILNDGRTLPVQLIARDPASDVAVLKIDATGLPAVPLAAPGATRSGEVVLAIGRSSGLDPMVTLGIVGAQPTAADLLQTDLAITAETAGGPIVNARGEAVGIATSSPTPAGAGPATLQGVPVERARPILRQLQFAGGSGFGFSLQPLTLELARSFGLRTTRGAVVTAVERDSPAARAGLTPGDVIVRVNGRAVDRTEEIEARLARAEGGKPVELTVVRDGRERSVRMRPEPVVGVQPGGLPPGLARLGLELRALTPELARYHRLGEDRGVVVTAVQPDSPAALAGLAIGDVVREVNRMPVEALVDVERGLRRRVGDGHEVLLRVGRDGSDRYVVVNGG